MECDVSAIKGGEPRVGRAKAQREQPLRRLPCGECSASFNLARNLALHTAAQHSQDGNPLICPGSMTHHSQPNTRRKCPHSHKQQNGLTFPSSYEDSQDSIAHFELNLPETILIAKSVFPQSADGGSRGSRASVLTWPSTRRTTT